MRPTTSKHGDDGARTTAGSGAKVEPGIRPARVRAVRPDAELGARGDPSAEPRPDAERGAGTVVVLGVAAVVLLLGLALAALGSAQQARGAAQAAADLGALAAATALRDGFDPCETAREAVRRNHGTLVGCEPAGGGVVEVAATRATVGLPGWTAREAVATARAGPRPAPPGG